MKVLIKEISITDTFGIAYRRFAPGTITRVLGRNGSGKSSILKSIAKVFAGGREPEIIRKGAKKSVVTLELSNGVRISKTTTAKTSNLEIIGADGEPINAPATYVERLADATSVDPGRILKLDASTAPGRKALIELLLELMPISFGASEISAAVSDYDGGDLDLTGMEKFKAALTEERRRIGFQERDCYGTVNTLRKALPEQDETNWSDELTTLENEGENAAREEANRILDIRAEAKEAATTKLAALKERETKLRNEFQAAMVKLNAETVEISRAIDTAENQAIEEVRNTYAPIRQSLRSNIAEVKQKAIAQTKAQGTRESIDQYEAKRKTLVAKQDKLTAALQSLDALKKSKLESLPVAGLEFAEDRVLVGGVPWEHCNTARRVEIALQLSALRSGDLNLLLLDNSNDLDTETRRMLEEGIVEAGFQLIEATVKDDSPLTIEVANEHVAVG